MGGMEKSKKNIYISSLPRSGSTLLGMILNQHEECFYMGESFYWGKKDILNSICSCGFIPCDFLKKIETKIIDNYEIKSIGSTVPLLDKKLNYYSGDKIENLYIGDISKAVVGFEKLSKIYSELTRKKYMVDSSSNIFVAKSLSLSHFWNIVTIIRDPRGVISSFKNAAIRNTLKVPEDLWCNYIKNYMRYLVHNNFGYILKYEDLCHNPEKEILSLCDYLEIKYSSKMLQFRQDRGHVFMANRMRLGGEERIVEDVSWKDNLTFEEKEFIQRDVELVGLYKNFGYVLD